MKGFFVATCFAIQAAQAVHLENGYDYGHHDETTPEVDPALEAN